MNFRTHINAISLRRLLLLLCLIVVFTAPGITSSPAQEEHDHDHGSDKADTESIGKVDFRVSCDESVRADFDHALGMMHHMMYEKSRAEFAAIAEKDPECGMAYWGIATTMFQPIWPTRPSAEDLQNGWEYIQKAKELKPGSKREMALVTATEAFFSHPAAVDYNTRINRWAESMEKAYTEFPKDHDIAAFYALSRLALAQRSDNPSPLHDEAEAVLRKVYERESEHPGAVHYTIHSNDTDGRANNSLDIVRSYGEIAPEVPHALHMPTHIYVRLGEWDEVIEWNQRSADAALKNPAGDKVSHHYPHAVDYMVYAYLQKGEDNKALDKIKGLTQNNEYQPTFISAFHLAAVPARYSVERRDWEEASELYPRIPGYIPWDKFPWAEGLSWYAKGLGAVHTGNMEGAEEAEKQLISLRDKAKSTGEMSFANYIEIDRLILSGWIQYKKGNLEEAEALIRSAAELESQTEKHPVTPGALLPPNEALGDLLMELNRPEEALAAYQASDNIWTLRYNTLIGAARAAAKAGDTANAKKYYGALIETAGNSDRQGVAEARKYMEEAEEKTAQETERK